MKLEEIFLASLAQDGVEFCPEPYYFHRNETCIEFSFYDSIMKTYDDSGILSFSLKGRTFDNYHREVFPKNRRVGTHMLQIFEHCVQHLANTNQKSYNISWTFAFPDQEDVKRWLNTNGYGKNLKKVFKPKAI